MPTSRDRNGRVFSFYIDDDLLSKINDYIASERERTGYHIPRSILIRRILRLGMAQLEPKTPAPASPSDC
jgi:hypothetical protein